MPKRAKRRAASVAKRKHAAQLPIPPKGPPVNLRPAGPHKDKRIEVLEREAEREMRADDEDERP
jgi:hypothetical protein